MILQLLIEVFGVLCGLLFFFPLVEVAGDMIWWNHKYRLFRLPRARLPRATVWA